MDKQQKQELRKLLNKAWDAGKIFWAEYGCEPTSRQPFISRRWRDVSKIIREAEKEAKQ